MKRENLPLGYSDHQIPEGSKAVQSIVVYGRRKGRFSLTNINFSVHNPPEILSEDRVY